MYKISSKSKAIGQIFLSFVLISGSLFSGQLTADAETTNDDIITTKFSGTLGTDTTESKRNTFFRPEMPGDVSFDESNQDINIEYHEYLLEKTWHFQEGSNSAKCEKGNYSDCGTWFDNQDFTGKGYPFQVTVREDEPDEESYLRNYFYKTITPSIDGNYSFLVTPPDNNEDLKEALDDTVLYLYKDRFDDQHPLHNLIAGHDDIAVGDEDKGIPKNSLSRINEIYLKAGVTYYMVMTGFWNGAKGNVSFEVTGPGSINDPDDTDAPVVPVVTSVTVTPDIAEIMQGGRQQLTVNVEVEGSAVETVSWTSSDKNEKVLVDQTGMVTVDLDAKPGDYTITATSTAEPSKSSTSTIKVTQAPVEPAVKSVTVTPCSANVMQGGSQQLSAVVEVVGGAEPTLDWSSNDVTGKVIVDETGKVTVAMDAKLGEYTIRATSKEDNSKYDSSVITVTQASTYSTAEISDQTATPLTEGYSNGTQETQYITVSNTGTGNLTNLRAELTAGDVDAFEVTPVAGEIDSGEEDTFTVRAKDGLATGTYRATVSLTADHLSAVSLWL